MLGAIIVAATAVALVRVRVRARGTSARTGSGTASPAATLALVVGLVYLNQVLVTVYVVREHGGNPSFIARHLPDGWFALAHGPVLDGLARHFPAPWLLAPSVLRVNALLELPLVVLGYLTLCRWCGPWVYERAVASVWPISLSWTATFCLIEWRLDNQYTVQDVVLRGIATVLVPLWVARLAPPEPRAPVDGVAGLVVFTASAVALGVLCLVVYDTALLYNLGHLDAQLPVAALAALVLAGARTAADRLPDTPPPGRAVHSLARTTGWLLVVGAVPALPIRYGLGFGTPYLSAAAALVLFTTAATLGARDAFERSPGRPTRWLLQMAAAGIAGLSAATAAAALADTTHTEGRLLAAATAGLLTTLTLAATLDRHPTTPIHTRHPNPNLQPLRPSHTSTPCPRPATTATTRPAAQAAPGPRPRPASHPDLPEQPLHGTAENSARRDGSATTPATRSGPGLSPGTTGRAHDLGPASG